jgi:Secretion system C-terminal sorting domain
MKKAFMLVCLIVSSTVQAQWSPGNLISFDPGDPLNVLVRIDTMHYHHNVWQIGAPHKTLFASAYSFPNAIVTDTLNPYPANDTSMFTLTSPANFFIGFANFEFFYQLDIDSETTAVVELSLDTGHTWMNLSDTLPAGFSRYSTVPDFRTSTTGWSVFSISQSYPYVLPVHTDSMRFRFKFISGPYFSHKDGWIIDSISIFYIPEGISATPNPNLFSICPNPSKGDIYIHANKKYTGASVISVYNMLGQEVYKTTQLPASGLLDLQLPDGSYMLRYQAGEEYCVRRLIISR